jgi:superfamily II DNA or RNA helicase
VLPNSVLFEKMNDNNSDAVEHTTAATRDFQFPFEPYDVQRDFMNELYDLLDRGGIGVFESPTGTVSDF